MTPKQKSRLFYDLIGWSMWAENSGVQAKAMREVKIQCAKMLRMFSNPLITPGAKEILGTPPGKKKLKKRGKAYQRLERQMKRIRECAEEVLKEIGKGQQRTKAKMKTRMQSLEDFIKQLSKMVEEKYGRQSQHLF